MCSKASMLVVLICDFNAWELLQIIAFLTCAYLWPAPNQ